MPPHAAMMAGSAIAGVTGCAVGSMKGDEGTAWCSTTIAKLVPPPPWMLGPTRGVLLWLRLPRKPGDRIGQSIGDASSSEMEAHRRLAGGPVL
mmetsp:Transcript_86302/g.252486  ORF Transcript_86302/g.252486 Transcript_86302/m.252486 type:complete len:93 (+) Transcript_86302:1302-1580(+)